MHGKWSSELFFFIFRGKKNRGRTVVIAGIIVSIRVLRCFIVQNSFDSFLQRVWSSWPQLGGLGCLGRFLGFQWDSLNFQHMLLFWFREASPNLSLFRQLFFQSFQGGTKGKMLKNCHNYTLGFSAFLLWSPLGNYEKKSYLNKLKFWGASRN